MRTAAFVFPHQLFKIHPVTREKPEKVLLIEDTLFFGDQHQPMQFHRQKLYYQRESMQAFAHRMEKTQTIQWVKRQSDKSELSALCTELAATGIERIVVCDVHDYLLQRRLGKASKSAGLQLDVLSTPMFLNTSAENQHYRAGKKRWFMADYYQWQRRRLSILMDEEQPTGGQWSFDEANRKKYRSNTYPSYLACPTFAKAVHTAQLLNPSARTSRKLLASLIRITTQALIAPRNVGWIPFLANALNTLAYTRMPCWKDITGYITVYSRPC